MSTSVQICPLAQLRRDLRLDKKVLHLAQTCPVAMQLQAPHWNSVRPTYRRWAATASGNEVSCNAESTRVRCAESARSLELDVPSPLPRCQRWRGGRDAPPKAAPIHVVLRPHQQKKTAPARACTLRVFRSGSRGQVGWSSFLRRCCLNTTLDVESRDLLLGACVSPPVLGMRPGVDSVSLLTRNQKENRMRGHGGTSCSTVAISASARMPARARARRRVFQLDPTRAVPSPVCSLRIQKSCEERGFGPRQRRDWRPKRQSRTTGSRGQGREYSGRQLRPGGSTRHQRTPNTHPRSRSAREASSDV